MSVMMILFWIFLPILVEVAAASITFRLIDWEVDNEGSNPSLFFIFSVAKNFLKFVVSIFWFFYWPAKLVKYLSNW